MSTAYFEKSKTKAVGLGPAGTWGKETSADGKTRTYTAGSDGGEINVKFADGTTQDHTGLKSGSKVIVHENGQVEIEEIT